jgi:type III restriction enzyme
MATTITKLIINSPFQEPKHHWLYKRETGEFTLEDGRRPAGYYHISQRNASNREDQGEFVQIELVNKIRPRVSAWREQGYPNVTRITKDLLDYWNNADVRKFPPFFCQLEAVETAIWLIEASDADKQGIEIPKDLNLERICFKLATGTGKTVVMAMIIAWQALNKIANQRDTRFSKNVLIMAPGITVKDRLQVLIPNGEDNFYESFNVIPPNMWQDFFSAKIVITNWHNLAPIKENSGPKVIKKGPESDEAFVRRVLPEFDNAEDILVINDEAHHCHRPDSDSDEDKEEKEKATIWVSGLDRINAARGIRKVLDLSATPFKPSGRNNTSEMLFPWIVSDFGLNDAIESGLVKTPKIAVRDDAALTPDLKSKLFHIYPEVKDDLNRKDENAGLPDLVRTAVSILSSDWLAKFKLDQEQSNMKTPPVLISICNSTTTSSRLYKHLVSGGFGVPEELQDASKLIRIDQDALEKLEAGDDQGLSQSKKELVLQEREKFNTVGKEGKAGQDVRGVIGVNMLSEGWDARNVTHILGLRAFSSQLLCEQVVGRGLRRISYDINPETGLFTTEYVTVFGVPFTILPVEGNDGPPPPPTPPKTKIEPILERTDKEISWPHILRVERKLSYYLEIDLKEVDSLTISAENTPTLVEVAPVIDGKPNFNQMSQVNLQQLSKQYRFESEMMKAVAQLVERNEENWAGDKGSKFTQLYSFIESFLNSDRLTIKGPKGDEDFRRIIITLNMQKIVEHLHQAIHQTSKEEAVPVFDPVRPIRNTRNAFTWYTAKPTMLVTMSQISHLVVDSEWEGRLGTALEQGRIKNLVSWVKNDHIGFEINYVYQGEYHTYYPDFIIRMNGERYLLVEVKGQKTDKDKAKWAAAEEWVKAVNNTGKFGAWEFKVLEKPDDIFEVIE